MSKRNDLLEQEEVRWEKNVSVHKSGNTGNFGSGKSGNIRYISHVSQLTCEMQRATPILEVACGEMGVALACFTCSLHANQQVIGVGLKSNRKELLFTRTS